MNCSERLKELRKDRRMTQLQVQMKTGIDQSEYSKMESCERAPTIGQAVILAELFGTSVDYICGITDEKQPYQKR